MSLLCLFFLTAICSATALAQTNIPVIPTQAWTATTLTVNAGDQVVITATGGLNWCTGHCPTGQNPPASPAGFPWSQYQTACTAIGEQFIAPGLPVWSLLGKIGANGQPFEVGTSLTLTASGSGELYLGVNDCYYADNTDGWTATVTIGGTDCSKLVTFEKSKLIVRTFDPWYFTSLRGHDDKRYISISDGDEHGDIPYGIYINAKDALVNGPKVDPSDLPQTVMVQNLTGWSGTATYKYEDEDDEHAVPEWGAIVNPAQPQPLALLDAPPRSTTPFYPAERLVDSPQISAPLRDDLGRRLHRIDYTKDFKTYIGCKLPSDSTFHPVEVISWHALYQGRMIYPLFGEPKFIGDHYFPVKADDPQPAIGDKVNTDFPNSNCFTVYVNFNGDPTRNPCQPAPN